MVKIATNKESHSFLEHNISSISDMEDYEQLVPSKSVLKDVLAFVEVRSGNEDRSASVCKELKLLGAMITKKLTNDVTHVIFKEGKKSTKDKAIKKGIHLVSVLWVDSCKKLEKHVIEKLYPANIEEKSGTPILFNKIKKYKFMQPTDYNEALANSAERCNKRRRRIQATEKWKQNTTPVRSPHVVLAADTQQVSPMADEMFTPVGKITIPETPPSMRERLEAMKKAKEDGERDAESDHDDNFLYTMKRKLFTQSESTPTSFLVEPTKRTNKENPPLIDEPKPTKGRKRKTSSLEQSKDQEVDCSENSRRKKRKTLSSANLNDKNTAGQNTKDLDITGENMKPIRNTRRKSVATTGKNEVSFSSVIDTCAIKKKVNKKTNSLDAGEKSAANKTPNCNRRKSVAAINTTNRSENCGFHFNKNSPDESNRDQTSLRQITNATNIFSNNRNMDKNRNQKLQVYDFADASPMASLKTLNCNNNAKLYREENNDSDISSDELILSDDVSNLPSSPKLDKLGMSMSRVFDGSMSYSRNGIGRPSIAEFKENTIQRKPKIPLRKQMQRPSIAMIVEGDSDEDNVTCNTERCTQDKAKIDANTLKSKKNRKKSTSQSFRNSLTMKKVASKSLVMTNLHREEQDIIISVVKKLGNFVITDNVRDNTTHVICGEPRRTLNVLHCIVKGCWLMTKEWVLMSLEAGHWLDEKAYEANEMFPTAKITRLEKQKAVVKYKMSLFNPDDPIYVSQHCSPPRDRLVQLLKASGAQITTSLNKAMLYIGSDFYPNIISLSPQWVLGCITENRLLDKYMYRLDKPKRQGSPEF